MDSPSLERLGDAAVLLRWSDRPGIDANRAVHAAAARLCRVRPGWLLDCVPAYASLALYHDPTLADPPGAVAALLAAADETGEDPECPPAGRVVELPVCYGGEHGPDLDEVAALCGLSPAGLVAAHAAGDYVVAMLGFSPGFPYLLGLDPALAVPRLATPRPRVPAGSVGIGGAQTGVYPDAGPGGWRLIGRTPAALFDAARTPPSRLLPGDRVRFVPVDAAAFAAWREPGR